MPTAQPNPPRRSESTEPTAPAPKSRWRWILSPQGLAVLVGVSVVLHGLGFLCFRRSSQILPAPVVHEIALGTFRCELRRTDEQRPPNGVTGAEFALHLTLLEQVSQAGRQALDARCFRVRQDIEQLLRQAHGGDFDDAKLAGLKHQVREQVNETLGMRAVGEVIVTELKLHRTALPRGPDQSSQAAAPGDAPWLEKPR